MWLAVGWMYAGGAGVYRQRDGMAFTMGLASMFVAVNSRFPLLYTTATTTTKQHTNNPLALRFFVDAAVPLAIPATKLRCV